MNATLQYSADKNNSVALNFYNILDKKDVVNDYYSTSMPVFRKSPLLICISALVFVPIPNSSSLAHPNLLLI